MAETTITPMDDGPYVVKGPVKVIDPAGNEFPAQGRTVALCRCGNSSIKPFCDGTHAKVGFKSKERAAKGAGA
ncbi:MAG: CDGSH iron-sulfur domain-containing protein [Dehalococcoidia bacterium]